MPQSRTSFEYRQQASLSQILAFKIKDYIHLAGTDTKTSIKIQRLKELIRAGIIDEKEPIIELALKLLNGDRMAYFATSERVNEITKMGLQMPKEIEEVDFDESG